MRCRPRPPAERNSSASGEAQAGCRPSPRPPPAPGRPPRRPPGSAPRSSTGSSRSDPLGCRRPAPARPAPRVPRGTAVRSARRAAPPRAARAPAGRTPGASRAAPRTPPSRRRAGTRRPASHPTSPTSPESCARRPVRSWSAARPRPDAPTRHAPPRAPAPSPTYRYGFDMIAVGRRTGANPPPAARRPRGPSTRRRVLHLAPSAPRTPGARRAGPPRRAARRAPVPGIGPVRRWCRAGSRRVGAAAPARSGRAVRRAGPARAAPRAWPPRRSKWYPWDPTITRTSDNSGRLSRIGAAAGCPVTPAVLV